MSLRPNGFWLASVGDRDFLSYLLQILSHEFFTIIHWINYCIALHGMFANIYMYFITMYVLLAMYFKLNVLALSLLNAVA